MAHLRARTRPLVAGLLAAAAFGALAEGASASAPIVAASVATKSGALIGPVAVRAKTVQVRVGGRRCTVAAGTPLAALLALRAKVGAAKVGAVRLKDYGGCGKSPGSSAQLYVTAVAGAAASGPDGWIYAVDGKRAINGGADPKGPFAKGPLKRGQAVAWRWCAASTDDTGGCGDELVITQVAQLDVARADGLLTTNVTVQLRRGSAAETNGSLMAPPAGTTLALRLPTGLTLEPASDLGAGTWQFLVPPTAPASAIWAATGPAGVSPAGKLWRTP